MKKHGVKLRVAFDGASFMWRGLLKGHDDENGYNVQHNGKEVRIKTAQWGFDNVTNYLLAVMKTYRVTPIDTIFVFEGRGSKSARQGISLKYKASDARAPEQYEEFQKLRDMLEALWLGLGGQILIQDGAEGDDTLAWLAKHTEDDLVIATYDNDLTVLNGRNAYGANVEVWINEMRGINKYGGFDYHLVSTYKALVGDPSDNIRGCPGFGEAAFFKLAEKYGWDGVQELHDMLANEDLSPLSVLAEDPDNKLLRKIWENANEVVESARLVRLRPEWVDTMRQPLTWKAGMVRPRRSDDDPRFAGWFGRQFLVTADNFDRACKFALPLIAQSREVALDIETSGCDESDEWLANLTKSGDSEDAGVDTFGHTLTGLSITFGDNNQYSMYFSVDHADTNNVSSEALRQFIAQISAMGKPFIIHNVAFELVVLFNEWGAKQADNGWHGFLPNVLDTALSCAYVDENVSRGLKFRSETVLNYRQTTFKEVTELTGVEEELLPGGRIISVTEPQYETMRIGTGVFEPIFDDITGEQIGVGDELTREVFRLDENGEKIMKTPSLTTKRYRMNELPAAHVVAYGCDDTITSIAHHNHNRLRCQLEHQWQTYLDVEIGAAYQHAKNFIDGVPISLEKMNQLAKADDEIYAKAWGTVRQYLIEQGWTGTTPPTYTTAIEPAQVKEAFEICTGRKLDTLMRTLSKLVTFIREVENEPLFARLLQDLLDGRPEPFERYVQSKFKGEPLFNYGSSLQKQRLLYATMGFEVKVRNKPTELMKLAGELGSPKTDTLAIAYAIKDAQLQAPELVPVLEAMRLMGMVNTRRTLYYSKYPYFPHWKDGRVHSNHNQSQTNTRRASSSKPNLQQLPKHPKIEGFDARFREVIVPHRPDAVVVSIDFKAQELRLIADYSKDPTMLSMYIGDNLRDQHSLTGVAIAQRRDPNYGWTYEEFEKARSESEHPKFKFAKECRALGKKLNFTAEYGAMAEKVAATLMVTVEEAQEYLDAREAMFALVAHWKEEVIAEAKRTGIVRTKLGAVRHLREALMSEDRSRSSKAERQAVNFEIQSSSAEQTKLAEGRMWERGLFFRYDAVCYGPLHDEIVASVRIADLVEFLPEMHACMTAPYADMEVPIEGDISFGPNYYKQIEIGPRPTREAIEKGLAELAKTTHREAA